MNKRFLDRQDGKKIDFWQILEFKSAKTEGSLASFILTLANSENLQVPARMFFSTKSPLETFLPQVFEFNRPIRNDLEYLEDRARLLSLCRRLQVEHDSNQAAYQDFENMKWLVKFQLYGFSEHCFERQSYLLGLLALKEAELLDKWQTREKLLKLAKKDKSATKIISEFVELS